MAKRKYVRKGAYVFTPARRAALSRARAASARARKGRSRRHFTSDPVKRGVGVAGLKKNTIPYARVNKRSQTVGVNAGTIIPFTKKRIAFGGYVRLENTGRKGAIDRALSKAGNSVAPRGTTRGKVRNYLATSVEIKNPAIRAAIPHGEVRLGTSRGAGPTFIVRRRKHGAPFKKSRAGVRKYDTRMRAIAGKKTKKPRPQRRG